MAKSNVKNETFLKSGDIVLLNKTLSQDCLEKKTVLSVPTRRNLTMRSQSLHQAPRPVLDAVKFVSKPLKASPMAKAMQATSITYGGQQVPAVKFDGVTTVNAPISLSGAAQCIPKQINQRGVQQFYKKTPDNSVAYSEKPAKPVNPLKRDITSRGQTTAVRRPSLPSDLTITPILSTGILKATTIDESPKVIGKPAQVFNIPVVSSIIKGIELEDKDTAARVTPKLGSVFTKETFYGNKIVESPVILKGGDSCYRHDVGAKVVIMDNSGQNPSPTRGRPRGSRNKVLEPVCLTISSDDEENDDSMSEPIQNDMSISTIMLRQSSTTSPRNSYLNKTQMGSCMNKSIGEHFMKSKPMEVDEEDEDVDEDLAEEVDIEEEEEMDGSDDLNSSIEIFSNEIFNSSGGISPIVIKCRSVRIGSYKIHPIDDNPHIFIQLSEEGFRFQIPTIKCVREVVDINLNVSDIQQVLGHFGRCLPILFIFNTPECGERIRKQLHMVPDEIIFFDPEGEDDRQKIITFLIDVINDEVRNFLRHRFPSKAILKEIDQKVANEILVKSTPQHNQAPPESNAVIRSTLASYTSPAPVAIAQNATVAAPVVIQSLPVKLSPVAPTPVTKILTYPPPPQTGGIAITSEDVLCLDEGEFLNDAIIDFYLRYLMNEMLSEKDRQRIHIFSSFFYPRLTQRTSSRLRSGEEVSSSMSGKRHSHVKTWTKNVDIFEKDFIIIPINQNVHWFLAIICFPGLVPEAPFVAKGGTKSSESVTSTNAEPSDSPENIHRMSPTTKDQACSTDDQSSDDGSSLSNEVDSSFSEIPIPEAPDSSTHPDKNSHHEKMPCILIFDSLSGPNRWRIVTILREYLDMEWKIKKGTSRVFSKNTMRGYAPCVPQQTNFSDCGVYVLQYVESFCQREVFLNPFPYFSNIMPQLPHWFPVEKVSGKRDDIKNLIFDLQKRQSGNSPSLAITKGNADRKEVERVSATSVGNSPMPTSS